MSYIVFARKYRPKGFDEVIGQEHIATTLKNAIKDKRVAHAYLFSGPRGIGKTTTARILAKALNCEKGPTPTPCNKCISCKEITSGSSMDVIEIDGASNRGIDEVRGLRENVRFAPTHGSYKLYIIDEVHMLTPEAFNALLKTLEEPPPHVKFVFATTQPNKVLATVLSRCQRFDFRRISTADIVVKLKEIAKKESIKIDEDALFSIARQSEGSLRDAESILDQMNTFCSGDIKKDDIARILGIASEEMLEEFVRLTSKNDTAGALNFIDRLVNDGKDFTFFLLGIIEYFRNLLVAKLCSKPEGLLADLAAHTVDKVIEQAAEFTQEELFYITNILTHTYESIKRSAQARVVFELAVVKITSRGSLAPLNEIMDKIEKLEKKIQEGVVLPRVVERKVQNNIQEAPAPNKKEIKKIEPQSVDTAVNTVTDTAVGIAEDGVDIELSKIEEIWPILLKIIRANKISIASYLLEANPLKCNNGTLTIGFPKNYSLHKEALEKRENRFMVEGALEDILKKKIMINFVVQDISKDTTSHGYSANTFKKDVPISGELLREPVIQSALEIFDGRIVRKMKQ